MIPENHFFTINNFKAIWRVFRAQILLPAFFLMRRSRNFRNLLDITKKKDLCLSKNRLLFDKTFTFLEEEVMVCDSNLTKGMGFSYF